MTDRLGERLRRFLRVKPGEKRLAFLVFSYFFLIAAPHAIINPLRTTYFLSREGVAWLPIAYLLAVGITGLVVFFYTRIQRKRSMEALIIASLVFFAVSGLLLQWVLRAGFLERGQILSYFYWVWASVLIIVLITGFWTTVNEIYNPRQAKRLIGFLNSGGILGGIVGGLLVGFLAQGVLGDWLMPLACVMLFGCTLVVRAVFRLHREHGLAAGRSDAEERPAVEPKTGFLDSFGVVRKDRFLTLIAAIVAVGIVVSTCIEFQFLSASYLSFRGSPRAMESFFGFFEPSMTVFAFFLNILVARFLLRKLTVSHTLLLTPAVLIAGSAAVLIMPFSLFSGILIRGSDESLAFSVSHPLREILYIPVDAERRHKAKAFIEMFISQFAKVAGAVVLLVFALLMNKQVAGFTPVFDPGLARYLGWVVIALLVPLAFFGLKIGKEYLATLRENIKPLWDRAEKGLTENVDVEHAKLVFETIDSRNYSSALYVLHLFDLLARDKLNPALRKVITEKSREVRAKAFNDHLEAGTATLFPALLDEIPPKDLMKEIPLILSSAEYQEVMTAYMEKLLGAGQSSEVQRMELAKVIGLMDKASPLAGQLVRLIDDDSPRVSSIALQSAGRLKKQEYIPAIVRKLNVSATFEDAIEALHQYGDASVGAIADRLYDHSCGIGVRRAVIDALARIGTRRAALALTEEFEHGSGELDRGIIDALDRLRSENKETPLSMAVARRKTFGLIKKFCQAFLQIQGLDTSEEAEKLRHHLAHGLEATLADIFKLLGLCYPRDDIRRAYQNIRTGTPTSVAHAVEWLDNALVKDMRDCLLPIVDDLSLTEKTARFREILKGLADV